MYDIGIAPFTSEPVPIQCVHIEVHNIVCHITMYLVRGALCVYIVFDNVHVSTQLCNVFFVSQLYDQYLNFVSLEEDFFITRHQNTRELSYYGKEVKERRKKMWCDGGEIWIERKMKG